MSTHFASPERSDDRAIASEIKAVTAHPVLDGVLHLVQGMVVILNKHRQIISLNSPALKGMNIGDPSTILGLRPGEAVGCRRVDNTNGGCGTGKSCSSCGAAIAIVTALVEEIPISRTCAIEVDKSGASDDLFLQVHAVPIKINNEKYIVLFLQDISGEQKRSSMEQIFFHDINNMLTYMVSAASLLALETEGENKKIAEQLARNSMRIAKEMAMQRMIAQGRPSSYTPVMAPVKLSDVFEEAVRTFGHHPAVSGKRLVIPDEIPDITFQTDLPLLFRVLTNMLVNACEATDVGKEIVFNFELTDNRIKLNVWNGEFIPDEIAARIFQRNFSTKATLGRGLGTYTMKLFGEKLLGGEVSFSTSKEDGTIFWISFELQT